MISRHDRLESYLEEIMKKTTHLLGKTGLFAASLAIAAVMPLSAQAEGVSDAEAGKELAFDRAKGNCLACHMIEGGASAGNIAPPLIAMQSRYPSKDKLKAQISDATKANPETAMPPFGKHEILSDKELNQLVEFIWTL